MIELTIANAFTIIGGIFSLFAVYVALNNRIVRLEEQCKVLEKDIKDDKVKYVSMASIIELNYKEFSKALHENSIAITQLKSAIENITEK